MGILTRITQIALFGLAVSAILIGLAIYIFGAHPTASVFAGLIETTFGGTAYLGDLTLPNADSELRFYSVFWLDNGAFAMRAAVNPA